ncbi:MAG TPA: hypothetical protein VEB64_10070 [Azospirillaceae bacterium]|nr:hypothetical protein [Azospirillaceae bacterium]
MRTVSRLAAPLAVIYVLSMLLIAVLTSGRDASADAVDQTDPVTAPPGNAG